MALFTYQTRLTLDTQSERILSDCATHFSKVERKLFAEIQRDSSQRYTTLKKRYLIDYQITARQFNTIYHQLQGKIEAINRLRERHVELLKTKIKRTQKTLKRLLKKREQADSTKKKSLTLVIHQKKKRLAQLESRYNRLLSDIKKDVVRLCFGSKTLFHQQFHLEANGYNNHEEWLTVWQKTRQRQFSLSGSKDETAGNQSGVLTRQLNGLYQLRVRLPNTGTEKYLTLTAIRFDYGVPTIEAAIDENHRRSQLKKAKNPDYKQAGVALSYRFVKDDKGWRLFLTTDQKPPKTITKKHLGVMGVDINENHLAVTETNPHGNPIAHWTIPLPLRHQSSAQREAIIGDAVKQLVNLALEKQKPVVKEQLDFEKKKAELERGNPRYARMLSSFAYAQLHDVIRSRCFRFGVECFEVNPAYTSVIGRIKFAKRYGLSVHHAAALVIGRRFLGCSERPPCQRTTQVVPTGKGELIPFLLPVRKAKQSVWSHWVVISRQFKVVLDAHIKAMKSRSSSGSSGSNLVAALNDELPF